MRGSPSSSGIFPEKLLKTLVARHTILKRIRNFFDTRGYIEVETPIRVTCPGIDPYIDAIPAGSGFYLATSPELQMKQLLHSGIEQMYQITHAFRGEEAGFVHNAEFTILEWYRVKTDYFGIMQETEELVKYLVHDDQFDNTSWQFPFVRLTVDEIYSEEAGWEPSRNWDENRYFKDWVEKIDPFLGSHKGIFLYDFPTQLACLARIKKSNQRVCERFELFMQGIEIANAYTELTDYEEHVTRFHKAAKQRSRMGKEAYPVDTGFLKSVNAGIPDCGGIAVGIDRLIMAIAGIPHIDCVLTFPMNRLTSE